MCVWGGGGGSLMSHDHFQMSCDYFCNFHVYFTNPQNTICFVVYCYYTRLYVKGRELIYLLLLFWRENPEAMGELRWGS